MAEPFKNLLSPALVELAAERLGRSGRGFKRKQFLSVALPGLQNLEMKARAMQIADALEVSLPAEFEAAAGVIEGALAPPHPGEALGQIVCGPLGLAGWIVWPLGEFVARRGIEQPERALACLHALTQRFSAEFAIRPFIVRHPELCWRTLQRWTTDPSLHVRRLVSEGSRPRLPWGLQLKSLIADPRPTEALLLALQDDPSAYVRRSVANHLNDIAKDHPERVIAWVRRHRPGASPEREALLKHASRTLIKQGHPAILSAWGHAPGFLGQVRLKLEAKQVRIGDSLGFVLELRSTAAHSQALIVDYAVLYLKSGGARAAKVFKGWQVDLPAGAVKQLTKRHSLREVSTRRLYPGIQALEIRVNGAALAVLEFKLLQAP